METALATENGLCYLKVIL